MRKAKYAPIYKDLKEKIAGKTVVKSVSQLFYIQRLCFLNGTPLILDNNYFLTELTF